MHYPATFAAPASQPTEASPLMVAQAIQEHFLAPLADSSRVAIRYAMARIAADAGIHANEGQAIETLPWHTLNASAVTRLVEVWRRRGLANSTISLNVQIIRGIARATFMRHLMSGDQFELLKTVKPPRGRNRTGRGRAVAQQWRDLLIEDCVTDERPQGVRDAAIIAVFFGVGIRRAEVSRIRVEDVDLQNGELRIKVKGGNLVTKYLSPLALKHLAPWMEYRAKSLGPKGPLFCRILKSGKLVDSEVLPNGLYYLLEQRSKRAGLPFIVRPHDARRTVGTWALSEHGELVAKAILGHASLSTTAIYDMRQDTVAKAALRRIE